MKHALASLRLLILFTLVLGLGYPLALTFLGHTLFPESAEGRLIRVNGQVIGSELIAQKFTGEKYFWPRPSAVDYNPLPSGGSNLSQASQALKTQASEREQKLKAANPSLEPIPKDLLYASASGLDPEISPAAANYQIERVALARHLTPQRILSLVDSLTERRQFGILGEPRVNVLKLNLALDQGIANDR